MVTCEDSSSDLILLVISGNATFDGNEILVVVRLNGSEVLDTPIEQKGTTLWRGIIGFSGQLHVYKT